MNHQRIGSRRLFVLCGVAVAVLVTTFACGSCRRSAKDGQTEKARGRVQQIMDELADGVLTDARLDDLDTEELRAVGRRALGWKDDAYSDCPREQLFSQLLSELRPQIQILEDSVPTDSDMLIDLGYY